MISDSTFLVRHGNYRVETGSLSPSGQEQAEEARDRLIDYGLGRSALLLSSSAKSAVETAEIIAQGLGVEVLTSRRIMRAGNTPEVVRDLTEFLGTTLDRLGVTREEDQPLIVVGHAPLIALTQGIHPDIANNEVEFGGVYDLRNCININPGYEPAFEEIYRDDLVSH